MDYTSMMILHKGLLMWNQVVRDLRPGWANAEEKRGGPDWLAPVSEARCNTP
jgi:hypothetical protein